jgi:PAS domain S-box-containing protein
MPNVGSFDNAGVLLPGHDGGIEFRQRETLLKTGALQAAILNSAHFSSIATDEKGVIQIFNVGAERMLGFAAADVLNRITPADISDAGELVVRAAALSVELGTRIAPGFEALVFKASRGIEDIYELTYIRKDGSRFPAMVSVTALRDVQERVIGFLLIGTDNTVRKKIEAAKALLDQELRDQRRQHTAVLQRFRTAMDATADAIVFVNRRTMLFEECNTTASLMLGYTRDELLRLGPAQVGVGEMQDLTRQYDAIIAGRIGGSEPVQTQLRRKDGVMVQVEIQSHGLQSDSDWMIVCVVRDITERNQAALTLARADAKLREQSSILDKALDAIIIRDLNNKVLYWNHGAERLYRWKASDILGQSVLGLMDDQAQFDHAMDQLMLHDEWVGELTQLDKDGSKLYLECHWTLVRDDKGRPERVLAINTDIRERKWAREEIARLNMSLEDRVRQRTLQLETANHELESFSYLLSHDLRTPLSAINGFSSLLGKEIDLEMASERAKHYLVRIRKGVDQMADLIDAMLVLSHVSRGSLKWARVDLSALAETVMAGYRERDPGRALHLEIEPGLWAEGDSRLLRQVLDNLLGNAWKFSAQRDVTHIALRREVRAGNEKVYIVRDNGAGFDMAYAGKLFGAFQRLHSLSEFPGTGIGLVVVSKIIARHGGRIWADSLPGQGASFYFTLGSAAQG